MKYRFFISFLLIFIVGSLHAQYSLQTLEKGYKIAITINDFPDKEKKVYLKGNFGSQYYILDSAKVKRKGKFTFQSQEKTLPSGIYSVETITGEILFNLLIDQNRFFSIETNFNNNLYLNYTEIIGSEENKIFFEYQKTLLTDADISQFINTSPESLLAKYLQALHYEPKILPDILVDESDSTIDSFRKKYEFYVFHYFDDIDFSDARLLNTPLNIDFDYFFTEILNHQESSFINLAADNIIEKAIDTINGNEFTRYYYLNELLKVMLRSGQSFDATYVYLYDKYYKSNTSFTPNYESRIFQQFANVKRRLLPGAIVPNMCANMTKDSTFCSVNIDKSYIILWLWDPDCDDCRELTPQLSEFYQQFHESFDFEVFAVSVTPDFERWQKFSKEHKFSWINLSYALGNPNYDFVEYFDVLTTPVIYLLDKNHKIIERNFSLDELYGIISNLNTSNN